MTFSRDGKRIEFVDLSLLIIRVDKSEIDIGDSIINVPANELHSATDDNLMWRRGRITCIIFVGDDEMCEQILDLRDKILAEDSGPAATNF